jgi:hypothetical protein
MVMTNFSGVLNGYRSFVHTNWGMVRCHALFSAMVQAITHPGGSPRRLAQDLSKAMGVHVMERGGHLVDCERLYNSGVVYTRVDS